MTAVQQEGRLRTAYRHAELLKQLGDEVTQLAGIDAVARHIAARIGEALDLRWVAITVQAIGPAAMYRWGDCPNDLLALRTEARDTRSRVDQQPATRGARVMPLLASRAPIGTLMLGPRRHPPPLSGEDAAFIDSLAPLVAVTLKTCSLIGQLERSVPALSKRERALTDLSLRLMRAQERERRRIALDLHDDALQRAILLARDMTETPKQPRIGHWRAVLDEIIDGLRATCADLRPPHLDDFGLVAALEWLADVVRARADLDVRLMAESADGAPFGRLPTDLELALFRIAQEALNNCLKHARGTQAVVMLWRDGQLIRLRVADDGRGCASTLRAQEPSRQLGILGMQERLRPWGGSVTMASRENEGTVLIAEVNVEIDDGRTD